jgi:hypothetical protein
MKLSLATRLRRNVLAIWKYCLSFGKREWDFADYPVDLVRQIEEGAEQKGPEWRKIPEFRADIVNWHRVSGVGNTPEEALQNLESEFIKKADGTDPLPRPGKKVPIDLQFATTIRIDANRELADRFIREVLGYEWAFISDESSLWDFTDEDSLDLFYLKIRNLYGVDISGLENPSMAEILETIARSQKESQTP